MKVLAEQTQEKIKPTQECVGYLDVSRLIIGVNDCGCANEQKE